MKQEKQSTKQCPKCGNTMLLRLTSLNLKICTDCNIRIPWYLEEGQESVL
jgi:ribosomal protein L37AE/L43A